jgi:hypothetical protein
LEQGECGVFGERGRLAVAIMVGEYGGSLHEQQQLLAQVGGVGSAGSSRDAGQQL